jgi:TonB family protein
VKIKSILSLMVALLFLLGQALWTETFAQGQRQPLVSVRAIEEKICKLQTTVLDHPSDLVSRKLLVQYLTILAEYSEKRGDNLTAWRYYEGAAKALRESKDKAMLAQVATVSEKAERNHNLRKQHLKNLKRLGFVLVKFDWAQCKFQDRTVVAAYLTSLTEKLRDAWSDTEHRLGLLTSAELARSIRVNFSLRRDGVVSDIKLISGCGNKSLDQGALETIESLAKQPALPTAAGNNLILQAEFSK